MEGYVTEFPLILLARGNKTKVFSRREIAFTFDSSGQRKLSGHLLLARQKAESKGTVSLLRNTVPLGNVRLTIFSFTRIFAGLQKSLAF